jgi:hypothetical protein
LWNNTADYDGDQITVWNGTVLSVSYCDIEGGDEQIHKNASCTINWGAGNLDAEPAFVGPGYWDANGTPADANDDFWRGGDYHLAVGSPCIDAGDNNSIPADIADLDNDGNTSEPIPWDIDTDARVSGGTVDMGSDEVIWDGATGIDPGGSVTLNPGGGPDDPNTEAIVVFDNNSVGDANITVVEMSGDPHLPAGGFGGLGTTLRIDTSVADGEFLMTVMIPFDADDLAGQYPLNVDLMWWYGDRWILAVAGNKKNSPGKPGPVGDRDPVVDTTTPELSEELGDYGVYWNPITAKGFVWANVDHASDFAGLVHSAADFEPDGDVDFVDFAYFAQWWQDTDCGLCGGADLTSDGNVDWNDLREFADSWLAGQ